MFTFDIHASINTNVFKNEIWFSSKSQSEHCISNKWTRHIQKLLMALDVRVYRLSCRLITIAMFCFGCDMSGFCVFLLVVIKVCTENCL